MPMDFDPSEDVELIVSFGTIQLLKEANKILKLFEEDDVVREIMNVIDMLHDTSIEYLEAVKGEGLMSDEDYSEDDGEDDDMVLGIEAEEEYE